jgi:hypothetical protein
MGVRYDIDAVDRVLDVLARDGMNTSRLLTLRSAVLAGDPKALVELRELADTSGITALLERSR